jgi:hypothetical protein
VHAGSIDRQTAARRVYLMLASKAGRWHTGWEIAMQARTTCVSTRISEVRHQLRGGKYRLESRCMKDTDGSQVWAYRVIKEGK